MFSFKFYHHYNRKTPLKQLVYFVIYSLRIREHFKMFYKGSGGLKSMFFEAISAAQKSEEKHLAFYDERNL